MNKMPSDTSCRPSHGGCGRPVIIVREPTEGWTFGNQISSRNSRLTAIHDDELDENPNRVVSRATPDHFNRLRLTLEMKCAAHHEQLKDATPMEVTR